MKKRNIFFKDSFTGKDTEPETIETELLLFQFWSKVEYSMVR